MEIFRKRAIEKLMGNSLRTEAIFVEGAINVDSVMDLVKDSFILTLNDERSGVVLDLATMPMWLVRDLEGGRGRKKAAVVFFGVVNQRRDLCFAWNFQGQFVADGQRGQEGRNLDWRQLYSPGEYLEYFKRTSIAEAAYGVTNAIVWGDLGRDKLDFWYDERRGMANLRLVELKDRGKERPLGYGRGWIGSEVERMKVDDFLAKINS